MTGATGQREPASADLADALQQLSDWRRAALATALLHLGPDAPRLLARLAGNDLGAELARRLRAADRDQRARVQERLIARCTALEPHGLQRVHRDWLPLQPIDTPATTALGRWRRRGALGHLVSMPTGPPPARASMSVRDLPLLSAAQLASAFDRFGVRSLAWALHRSDDQPLHTIGAQLGAQHGRAFAAAIEHFRLLRTTHQPARMGPVRAALQRMRGLVRDTPYFLARLAARGLAPHLRHISSDVPMQIAQRLPRSLGQVIASELQGEFRLLAHVETPHLSPFLDCIEDSTTH